MRTLIRLCQVVGETTLALDKIREKRALEFGAGLQVEVKAEGPTLTLEVTQIIDSLGAPRHTHLPARMLKLITRTCIYELSHVHALIDTSYASRTALTRRSALSEGAAARRQAT